MIDQTTVGHQFLNRSFGFTPTIGWQIDPFGHSGTQASLMTGALGFDAIYFARTDYQVCFACPRLDARFLPRTTLLVVACSRRVQPSSSTAP